MTLKGQNGALTIEDFRWTGPEQRREQRIALSKPVWIYRPAEPPQIGHLVDCSPHGVGVLLERSLREGDQFGLRLQLDRLRLATYNVRHCHPQGGRYKVGALLCGVDGGDANDDLEGILRALLEAASPPSAPGPRGFPVNE